MTCSANTRPGYDSRRDGAMDAVTLVIDDITLTVPAETSLLQAAMSGGIRIPRLCATDCVQPTGSCRLCIVEVEGRNGYPPACVTPVREGMKVLTQTPTLQALRKEVLKLLLVEHACDCAACAANGDCELQAITVDLGMDLRSVTAMDTTMDTAHNAKDDSNPYFSFDSSRCILCQRCVRACEEIQGRFALAISGRGARTQITAGNGAGLMASECVSCGACVTVCPTGALLEKSVIANGQPDHRVVTTCGYCGVGCRLVAETRAGSVVRMTPWAEGKANAGHACVKGRFAWGFVTHEDRVTQPMIRPSINDPWKTVSWNEAFDHIAREFQRIQRQHGREAVGGITSSRCTNEETFLAQKMVRVALGNNNVDNCARVCHAPTGYGLGKCFGTSAGTQDFSSVDHADVIMVIGANPTEAHPAFGSRLLRRVRQGAQLIVIDPRRIDLVNAPYVSARFHLQLTPGTNVAVINALAHVIVTEGLIDEAFVAQRCDPQDFSVWRQFVMQPENAPEHVAALCGVSADLLRAAARLYATGGNAAIYYGLGVTEHAQGSTMVMGIAHLAMATGNIGRAGVGVNPLRGQNNVQGACDMGSFPHDLPGYQPVTDAAVRGRFEAAWGVTLNSQPGLRIPHMFDAALAGTFKGLYCQGEDPAQSDPNTQKVVAALSAMECVVVQDLFLNETSKYAHVFLPGASFLEKDGTFTNGERRIARVRQVVPPLGGLADWEVTQQLTTALGYPLHYNHPSEIMDEIASLIPAFAGVSYAKLDRLGDVQWPCNDNTPEAGTSIMHAERFAHGLGRFTPTPYVATDEKISRRFPLLLTTGRVLMQYNVGTQTRRTDNIRWHGEDRLEIHRVDAEERRIEEGDWVIVESRIGETRLRATLSERVQPGVIYTSFHFPESGTNRVTTPNADWATDCPEYKVTAVEVRKA